MIHIQSSCQSNLTQAVWTILTAGRQPVLSKWNQRPCRQRVEACSRGCNSTHGPLLDCITGHSDHSFRRHCLIRRRADNQPVCTAFLLLSLLQHVDIQRPRHGYPQHLRHCLSKLNCISTDIVVDYIGLCLSHKIKVLDLLLHLVTQVPVSYTHLTLPTIYSV